MMIKAEIKRFCIWDEHNQHFYPEDPEDFFAMVDMDIGIAGSDGGDIFVLGVCTPRWFEKNVMVKQPADPTHETIRRNIFGRHYLFVHSYDEAEIKREVQNLVERVQGKNWRETAIRLSRFFGWEFEDLDDFGGLPKSFLP